MKFCYLGPQAISRDDLWSFIIAMWVRNQNLCIPLMEGAISAKTTFDPYTSNVLVQSGPVGSTKKPASQYPVRCGSCSKASPVLFLISAYFKTHLYKRRGEHMRAVVVAVVVPVAVAAVVVAVVAAVAVVTTAVNMLRVS